MAGSINYPDTIFDLPFVSNFPTGIPAAGFTGGRLMSSGPHVDGVYTVDAGQLDKDSANLVLTRNANGDWSLNRTAAGAETYHCRINLSELIARTGEVYSFGMLGYPTAHVPAPPAKGFQVASVFALYSVGVASLTSATLRYGKSVFVSNVALAQTDILAATTVGAGNLVANGGATACWTPTLAVAAPVFAIDALAQHEIELTFVMANTGTIRVYGVGALMNFNYN